MGQGIARAIKGVTEGDYSKKLLFLGPVPVVVSSKHHPDV